MMKKLTRLLLALMAASMLFTSVAVYAEGENPETQSEEQQTTGEQENPAEDPEQEQENPEEETQTGLEPPLTLSAGAQEPVTYIVPEFNTAGKPESGIKQWNEETCTEYQFITSGKTASFTEGGWYVVKGSVNLERLTLGAEGTVTNLILCDSASLYVGDDLNQGGILTAGVVNFYVQAGKTGKLTAEGYRSHNAAIGSKEGTAAAQLNFYGGTITATSNAQSAAIGYAKAGKHSDTITVYGGTITARARVHGPGICCSGDGIQGGFTMYGGKVIAYGCDGMAGIGTYESDAYNIAIYDGTVEAHGGSEGGAGLGGGLGGTGYSHSYSAYNIHIYGGTVTAYGALKGAGIGASNKGTADGITISGGKVYAYGGTEAAGIGAAYRGKVSNIEISGGTVCAIGGTLAAGIGAGKEGTATNIKITGGNITALGGTIKVSKEGVVTITEIYEKTAGIGAGHKGTIDGITISGGTVNAYGGTEGAGIGAAYQGTVKNITISQATEKIPTTVTATGGTYGAGIGGGKEASATGITISGGSVTAAGGESAAGIGGGYKGSGVNITISGGYVEAKGGAEQGAGIGGGDYGASDNILISGGRVKVTEVNNGSAAIGGGRGAVCGRVTISGGYLELKGGYWGPAIGSGANCYSGYCEIKISNAAVYCHAVAGGGYPAIGIAPFDGSNVLCDITVSGDNTKIWNMDTKEEIQNSGENLSGTLGDSSILVTNGTIVSMGTSMKPVEYSASVSTADKARIEQSMKKLSIQATGGLELLESQFELAQSILQLTDAQMLDVLANKNQRIELSLAFEAEVVEADFSDEKNPVIEYGLNTVAVAELYDTSAENPDVPIQTGTKIMQPSDFNGTEANLSVTMPVPAGCVLSTIRHTSNDGEVVYDEFKQRDCTLNTTAGTITVNIPHCSHLVSYFKQGTQKSPQTGDSTLVILSAGLLVLSACAAFGIVSLRRKSSHR